MPAYTRGRLRDVATFVPLNTVFHYGWKATDLDSALGISAVDLNVELGHMTATAAAAVVGAILVTGANSPKPHRVKKNLPTAALNAAGSVSTFVAYNSLAAATTAGWTMAQRGHGVRLTASTAPVRRITAIATLSNGVNYAFPMDKADFGTFGADLGLKAAETMNTTTERARLVTGARTKPGRCSKAVGSGSFSSFYSTDSMDSVIGLGYNIDTEELIEFN